jgi:uncharacterized membrane protein
VKTLRKIGDAIKSGDDKGIIIAVAAALIIIAAIVAGYYIVFRPTPEGFTSMYVLDAQGQAVNYTETLVVNQPTTYSVFVVNHDNSNLQCEVQVKTTNQTISLFPINIEPVSTYDKTVANGETWEQQASVTLHEAGSHDIIFELWTRNAAGELEFSGNAVKLSVDAINQG